MSATQCINFLAVAGCKIKWIWTTFLGFSLEGAALVGSNLRLGRLCVRLAQLRQTITDHQSDWFYASMHFAVEKSTCQHQVLEVCKVFEDDLM